MKIAYLHGLESFIDPSSLKILWLKENFDQIYTPTIKYHNKESFTSITAHIKKQSPDYIVGSSMGGYFAYLIGATLGITTILFNPAVIGRSFDPVVDDSKIKETSHNVFLGKTDDLIDGALVQSYFSRFGLGKFTYTAYEGGHRVSAEVFIDSIKNVAGVLNSE
jgi:predicted esterase YcpF (UPF0227 family)